MPFNNNTKDNENYKFFNNGNDEATVRVGGTGTIISGIQFDEIQATYPSGTIEIYQYLYESNVVATVTVTYTNSSKNEVQSVLRS
jgi:hypothetical protein